MDCTWGILSDKSKSAIERSILIHVTQNASSAVFLASIFSKLAAMGVQFSTESTSTNISSDLSPEFQSELSAIFEHAARDKKK